MLGITWALGMGFAVIGFLIFAGEPRLDGQIDIELRAARSGSKKNTEGVSMVGGGLRAQARLKFKGMSPYTLDNPESIKLLMGNKWANKHSQR